MSWTTCIPNSIQTQSRALRKQKPQETQALALASSQSWLPLLRPSIPIGWRLRLLREIFLNGNRALHCDASSRSTSNELRGSSSTTCCMDDRKSLDRTDKRLKRTPSNDTCRATYWMQTLYTQFSTDAESLGLEFLGLDTFFDVSLSSCLKT